MLDLPERNDPDFPTSTLPGVDPFSTTKLLVLDDHRFNEVRDYGEVAMGRPDVLAGFIEEAAGRYPAAKYGLSLFDHGGGSFGGYIDEGPPSTTGMTVPDIRAGMAAGGPGGDRPVRPDLPCGVPDVVLRDGLGPRAAGPVMAGSEENMIQYPLSLQGFPALARTRRASRSARRSSMATAAARRRRQGERGSALPRPGGHVRRRRRLDPAARRRPRVLQQGRRGEHGPRSPSRSPGLGPRLWSSSSVSRGAGRTTRSTTSTSATSCDTSRTCLRRWRSLATRHSRRSVGRHRPGHGSGHRAGDRAQRVPPDRPRASTGLRRERHGPTRLGRVRHRVPRGGRPGRRAGRWVRLRQRPGEGPPRRQVRHQDRRAAHL